MQQRSGADVMEVGTTPILTGRGGNDILADGAASPQSFAALSPGLNLTEENILLV